MLSYQHDYHCGNHGDVLKHTVLTLVIRALQRKDTPLRVFDAHAGSGSYDLRTSEARRNEEFRDGVARVLAGPQPPPEVQDYVAAVLAVNGQLREPGGELTRYPGSPEIARRMLRTQDQLELLELHPRAVGQLRRQFSHDPRVHIHERDAFEGIAALVPPAERRGIVLVDPAYEVKEDFASVVNLLRACHRRWASGVYLLWYPLIRHPQAERFPAKVRATGIPKLLQVELQVQAEAFPGLRGSGLCIVNPPFGLEDSLNTLLPWLWQTLKDDERSGWRVEWLTPP